jgi:hypothetical protein
MKKSELQQIIREEINKTINEAKIYNSSSDAAKKLMRQLEDLVLNGEISNPDIEELRSRLRTANLFSKYKLSPEKRRAAFDKEFKDSEKAEKELARDTKKPDDAFKVGSLTKKQNKERKDANKLPLVIYTSGRVGAIGTELGDMRKYYDIVTPEIDLQFHTGAVYGDKPSYILNPKYRDKSFAKAKIAWSVWESINGKL